MDQTWAAGPPTNARSDEGELRPGRGFSSASGRIAVITSASRCSVLELPAPKLIDEVGKLGLYPQLKSEGYKKRARTFCRSENDAVQVVSVQPSKWNSVNAAQFTINLGVFFPAVREAFLQPPLDGPPKEYDCTLRQRIGMLMPKHADHWWDVTPDSDLLAIASEVKDAWDSSGRSWIHQCSTLEGGAVEAERTGDTITAAVIAALLSDKAKAKRLFDEFLAKCRPGARPHTEAIGKKLGLIT